MAQKYYIYTELSNKVLDIYGYSTDQGATAGIHSVHGQSNQQFTISADGTITGVGSGLALSVSGDVVVSDADIVQYTNGTKTNQKWTFSPDGTVRLKSNPNWAWDVASTVDGSHVILRQVNGYPTQKFRIIPIF